MTRSLLCVLVLITSTCFAQSSLDSLRSRDNYIINSATSKKGVYKTFEEFKYNNPSLAGTVIFEKKRVWLVDSVSGEKIKVRKGNVWGFSDGTRIFVRRLKYNEILEKGRYCYFREKGTRVILGIYLGAPMILPIPVPYNEELIINFNTGKMYLLSKKLMKQILTKDDPELLVEFNKEPMQRKMLYEYILRYNRRNVNRIK